MQVVSSLEMKAMNKLAFLDTNILVYAFDRSSPKKSKEAQELIVSSVKNGTGVISWQVAQEFLSLATKKFLKPLSLDASGKMLRTLLVPIWRQGPTPEIFQEALQLHFKYKFSFYDSLIWSAASVLGCKTLYSEDFQHNQSINGVKCINPF